MTGQACPPFADDTLETSEGGTTDEDQRDSERNGACSVDGRLGSTKAAGETNEEYLSRAKMYDGREDRAWQTRRSAETESANFALAVRWDKEEAAEVSRRRHSRRRSKRGRDPVGTTAAGSDDDSGCNVSLANDEFRR